MEEHGLSLAAAKTEIVMFTRKQIDTVIPIRIDDDTFIETKRFVKSLGIILDTKLNYWQHIFQRVKKVDTSPEQVDVEPEWSEVQ